MTTDLLSDESDAVVDEGVESVIARWLHADAGGERTSAVFRATFDQLYDGVHTGRFRWDQLYKTEKTHFGTLLEINLRREFADIIGDGGVLDYVIADEEIDCKYSQAEGGWMIPPEAFGKLLLVAHAVDASGWWSLGVVRASPEHLRTSSNRDQKTQLNPVGRKAIRWIAHRAAMAPNVLLSLPEGQIARIFAASSGQQRINELCRQVINRRIGRNTIATVAQQSDYMKRVRYDGGARSLLGPEGYIVPGGDYDSHREVARALGAVVPQAGEVVSLRVVPDVSYAPLAVELDGSWWRIARPDDVIVTPAPRLPSTRRGRSV
mgnify:CR=1 FL=1